MAAALVDTNLLCLLVVGYGSREAIGRHKRLRAFTPEDFDLLVAFLNGFSRLITTPQILAETSNLLRHSASPVSARASETLAALSRKFDEANLPAREIFADPIHRRLGFTDAAILAIAPDDAAVVTDDLDLYLERARRGLPAFNFNHLRERRSDWLR